MAAIAYLFNGVLFHQEINLPAGQAKK